MAVIEVVFSGSIHTSRLGARLSARGDQNEIPIAGHECKSDPWNSEVSLRDAETKTHVWAKSEVCSRWSQEGGLVVGSWAKPVSSVQPSPTS